MIPIGSTISHCSSCGRAIVWCMTVSGKKMPVDVEPIEGGNCVVTSGPEVRVLTKQELAERTARGERAHRSHFATCPHAASHRKS